MTAPVDVPRHVAELTWSDLAHTSAVLVVPVGSTEQHGPHLPLTVDTDIATALASRLVARRADTVLACAIAYGSSGEHQGFPGTLSIGQEATELLLVELGRSATVTFPRVLFVSGHGGNAAPIRRAVERLRAEGRDVRAWAPSLPGDAHAGHTETSIMLHLAPSRVRSARAAPGCIEPLDQLLPRLRDGDLAHVSPTGVLGDPTEADAETGRRLLENALADLLDLVDRWNGS